VSCEEYQLPTFVPTPPPFPPPPPPAARTARGSVGRQLSPTHPKPPSPKSVPRPHMARGHAPARASSSSSSSARPAAKSVPSIRPSMHPSTSVSTSSSSRVPDAAAPYARFLEVFHEMQTAADAAGVDLNLDVNLPSVEEVACKLEEAGETGREDAADDAEEGEACDDETTGRVELAVVHGKAPWASRQRDAAGVKGVKGKGKHEGKSKGKSKGKSTGKVSKGGQIRMREDGGLSCFSCVWCCIK
jgi:hypothetical protein